jgi:hypothetical protein
MSAHPSSYSFRPLRLAFLLIIGVDFCLIGLRLVISSAFFSLPGSLGYVVAPAVLLVAYGVTGLILLAKRSEANQSAVRIGSRSPIWPPRRSLIQTLPEATGTVRRYSPSLTP